MLVSPETAEAVEKSDANRLGQDARFGHGAVAIGFAAIGEPSASMVPTCHTIMGA